MGLFKSLGHLFHEVAPIALPIIGNSIAPGIGGVVGGALGGVAGGGGLKGGLEGAVLGGLGSAFGNSLTGGALGSLESGISNSAFGRALSPLGSALSGFGESSGINSLLGSLGNLGGLTSLSSGSGAMSGAPSGLGNASDLTGLSYNAPRLAGGAAEGAGAAGAGAGENSMFNNLSRTYEILQALKSTQKPAGLSQEDILAQRNAENQQQQNYSADFIKQLQDAQMNRTQTSLPDQASYYNYGQMPEHSFFDNVNPRIKFAEGGVVQNPMINRTFNPMANPEDYMNYGSDPAHNFFQNGAAQDAPLPMPQGALPLTTPTPQPQTPMPTVAPNTAMPAPMPPAMPPHPTPGVSGFNVYAPQSAIDRYGSLWKHFNSSPLGQVNFTPQLRGMPAPHPMMARGGMVQQEGSLGALIPGDSGGQQDAVDASLSSGEYVIPADAVAHLGDGNNQAGGKKLDGMVSNIRAHKAKKGFPPKSKKPEKYMPQVVHRKKKVA